MFGSTNDVLQAKRARELFAKVPLSTICKHCKKRLGEHGHNTATCGDKKGTYFEI